MNAWKLADWFELIKLIATVFTAIVAWVGVRTAREGLTKWRSETLGKRRAEVAEQLLASAYEVREILQWVRIPVILAGEGESRKADSNESLELRERRNSLYIPIERLNQQREIFAELQALRFTVAALFGEEAMRPINALLEGHRAIGSAATQLIIHATVPMDSIAAQGFKTFYDTLGMGIGDRPDEFDRKINEAISAIEKFCRPPLEDRVRE